MQQGAVFELPRLEHTLPHQSMPRPPQRRGLPNDRAGPPLESPFGVLGAACNTREKEQGENKNTYLEENVRVKR